MGSSGKALTRGPTYTGFLVAKILGTTLWRNRGNSFHKCWKLATKRAHQIVLVVVFAGSLSGWLYEMR